MPSGSAPARAPISCPRATEPRRSVPPTTTMPGALMSIFSSIWPIRPAQPTTPTLTAPLLGRLTLTGAGLGGPDGRVAAGFSGDFKSIGLFCRALVPALAAGLAAALADGL